jgi:hypothetical protein
MITHSLATKSSNRLDYDPVDLRNSGSVFLQESNRVLDNTFAGLFDLEVCPDSLARGIFATNPFIKGTHVLRLGNKFDDYKRIDGFEEFFDWLLIWSPFQAFGPGARDDQDDSFIHRNTQEWLPVFDAIKAKKDFGVFQLFKLALLEVESRFWIGREWDGLELFPFCFCMSNEQPNGVDEIKSHALSLKEELQAQGALGTCVRPSSNFDEFRSLVDASAPLVGLLRYFSAGKPQKLEI